MTPASHGRVHPDPVPEAPSRSPRHQHRFDGDGASSATGDATGDAADVDRRAVLPVVAVVGRPNVGKSTLVNRLSGSREAIVEDTPGVTRDRKEVEAEWNGRRFTLMDTGGWLSRRQRPRHEGRRQAEKAIAKADLVLLVVDVTSA